jgi:hypothetical protein
MCADHCYDVFGLLTFAFSFRVSFGSLICTVSTRSTKWVPSLIYHLQPLISCTQTPRSQRTSQDNQTWEFSHPKFLKGRVDLLDQIKRKALDNEPPGRNTRVELPAEVATQLRRMVQEHQSLKHALAEERARVEGLTDVVKMLYDIVATTHPGQSKLSHTFYSISAR